LCRGANNGVDCFDKVLLTGQGVVAITFVEPPYSPDPEYGIVLEITDVTYTFVIPEPSTFWLVASFCAVCLVCSVRRKWETSGPPKC
jgi:hypothetical protein